MTEEIHKKQLEHGVVENHKQQSSEPPAKVPVIITVDSEEVSVPEDSSSVATESSERRVSIAMLLFILLAFAIEWSFARIEFFIPTSEMDPDWIEKLELHQVTHLLLKSTITKMSENIHYVVDK